MQENGLFLQLVFFFFGLQASVQVGILHAWKRGKKNKMFSDDCVNASRSAVSFVIFVRTVRLERNLLQLQQSQKLK